MTAGGDGDAKEPSLDVEAFAGAHSVEAIRDEHNLSFFKALKLYPKAIGWSAYVSIGVIMLAFDPQLVGNLYSTPEFSRHFGYKYHGKVCTSSKRSAAGLTPRVID